jgi:hypothetical protein
VCERVSEREGEIESDAWIERANERESKRGREREEKGRKGGREEGRERKGEGGREGKRERPRRGGGRRQKQATTWSRACLDHLPALSLVHPPTPLLSLKKSVCVRERERE